MNVSLISANNCTYDKASDILKMRSPKSEPRASSAKPQQSSQIPVKGMHLGWGKPGNPHSEPVENLTKNGFSFTKPVAAAGPVPASTSSFVAPTPKPAEQISPNDLLLQKLQPVNTNIMQLLAARDDSEAVKA
jgi:hypothetical protein